MVSIQCDHCFKTYKVKQEMVGKRVKCKNCGQPITISDSIASPVSATNSSAAPATRVKNEKQRNAGKGRSPGKTGNLVYRVSGFVALLLVLGIAFFAVIGIGGSSDDDARDEKDVRVQRDVAKAFGLLQAGMSKDEVIDLMGYPLYRSDRDRKVAGDDDKFGIPEGNAVPLPVGRYVDPSKPLIVYEGAGILMDHISNPSTKGIAIYLHFMSFRDYVWINDNAVGAIFIRHALSENAVLKRHPAFLGEYDLSAVNVEGLQAIVDKSQHDLCVVYSTEVPAATDDTAVTEEHLNAAADLRAAYFLRFRSGVLEDAFSSAYVE